MSKNVTKIVKIIDNATKRTTQQIHVTPSLSTSKLFRCMWCTLPIESGRPIGCPIDVIEHYVRGKNIEQISSKEFVTYGIFCSFNCAKAFATDRRYDYNFSRSQSLLSDMYRSIHPEHKGPVVIHPAPHISLLQCYGGDMSELRYRESFDKIVYDEKHILKMFPVTKVFEEHEIM